MKRTELRRTKGLETYTPLKAKRRGVSPASPEQREKVRDRACVVCAGGPCDPAHLTARGQGGCDHRDCVLPMCRGCHRAFDEGALDIESVLALPEFCLERAHMAWHMSFARCVQRLRGMREAA